MFDYTSTPRQIAQEKGCSVATVEARAEAAGIRLIGRSPAEHELLLEALKDIKPRKRIGAPVVQKSATNKTKRRTRKKAAPAKDESLDLSSYFNQGKAYITEIRRRLAALDKEMAECEGHLGKLYKLYPEMKK